MKRRLLPLAKQFPDNLTYACPNVKKFHDCVKDEILGFQPSGLSMRSLSLLLITLLGQ